MQDYLLYWTNLYLKHKSIDRDARDWLVNEEGDLGDALIEIRDFIYGHLKKEYQTCEKKRGLLRMLVRDPVLRKINKK